MRRAILSACGALMLVTACSGGSSSSALPASPSPAPSPSPLPTCAPAKATSYSWPAPVPADLPKLPSATLGEIKKTTDGLTVVRFSTATSLRDGVIFIVRRLPPAGYTLGRGDAELTEADAPFSKGDLRGVLRGAARTTCQTDWLLAVTRTQQAGTGTPLLPTHSPGPSPSPLPFG